jgi:hypothetical protein
MKTFLHGYQAIVHLTRPELQLLAAVGHFLCLRGAITCWAKHVKTGNSRALGNALRSLRAAEWLEANERTLQRRLLETSAHVGSP